MKEKRTSSQAKYGEATKVVRLPETLANFFRQYPTVITKLVSQIEAGELNLSVDITACNTVTDTQAYDFDSKINNAIAPLLARLEALENTRSEATAPVNFTQALLRVKEVAPLKLMEVA